MIKMTDKRSGMSEPQKGEEPKRKRTLSDIVEYTFMISVLGSYVVGLPILAYVGTASLLREKPTEYIEAEVIKESVGTRDYRGLFGSGTIETLGYLVRDDSGNEYSFEVKDTYYHDEKSLIGLELKVEEGDRLKFPFIKEGETFFLEDGIGIIPVRYVEKVKEDYDGEND